MKRILFILPVIGTLFMACEDVIEVDINEENSDLFAVEARITTIDPPSVFLTKGLPVTIDQPLIGVSNAIVKITDNDQPINEIILTEDPDSMGYYVVSPSERYIGVAGKEYTLTIEVDDITLSATEYLSPVESIDSIQVRPSTFGEGRFLAISIFSQETPGTGNYYKWDIFINDTLLSDSETMSFASDELVDGSYVDDAEIFIDFNNPHQGYDRQIKYMDTVLVHQNSISEYAYNFYYQMQQQSYGGGLFSVPPANVKSNITASNGKDVLGMFTAQDVSVSNIVIIDDSIEEQLQE